MNKDFHSDNLTIDDNVDNDGIIMLLSVIELSCACYRPASHVTARSILTVTADPSVFNYLPD